MHGDGGNWRWIVITGLHAKDAFWEWFATCYHCSELQEFAVYAMMLSFNNVAINWTWIIGVGAILASLDCNTAEQWPCRITTNKMPLQLLLCHHPSACIFFSIQVQLDRDVTIPKLEKNSMLDYRVCLFYLYLLETSFCFHRPLQLGEERPFLFERYVPPCTAWNPFFSCYC